MVPVVPTVKVNADHSCNWRCCCCLCPKSDLDKVPARRETSGSDTITVEKTKITMHHHLHKEVERQ